MAAIFQALEKVPLCLLSSATLRGRRCSWLPTFRRPKLPRNVGNRLQPIAGQHPRRTKASNVRLLFFLQKSL